MAKIGSYRWEGKEKIRKDRDLSDRSEIREILNEIKDFSERVEKGEPVYIWGVKI